MNLLLDTHALLWMPATGGGPGLTGCLSVNSVSQ